MAKRGLGKGLGALFGEEVTLEENATVKEEKPSAAEKKEKGRNHYQSTGIIPETGKKQKRSLLKRS